MPAFMQFVATLREHMQADLARSDVLRALLWPLGMLLAALTFLIQLGAPSWTIIAISVALGGFLLLYFGAYLFCLINDRDALRSEKYSLHKMAIERGLIGDSASGLREAVVQEGVVLKPVSPQTLLDDNHG